MKRVAVLGGSFDPVHQVMEQLALAEGWLVPSNQSPLRPTIADARTRLEMTRAAAHGLERIWVDDLEIRRGGMTYTIDSLNEWHAREPELEVNLIVGSDSARTVPNWNAAEDLLRRANFVIINRNGSLDLSLDEVAGLGFDEATTRLLHVNSPAISATEIRGLLQERDSVAGLVPPEVLRVIEREHLYVGT